MDDESTKTGMTAAESLRTVKVNLPWNRVETAMPRDKEFVLVACKHGYRAPDYVLRTAKTDMEFRPPIDGRVRWLTESGDDLSDESLEPVFWVAHPSVPHA